MRGLGALVVLVALAGCSTPPAVTVASFVLDGVSFLATGKSVGDHALSIATKRDCAMWRILKERNLEAICRDDETAIAADDRPPPAADLLKPSDDRILTSSFVTAADPGAVARLPEVAAWDPVVLEPAANAPPAFAAVPQSPTSRKATYLVAGSFRRLGRAERLTESLGGYPVTIKSAVVGEQVYYRVLTGPYSGDEIAAARNQLTMLDIGIIWAISLCTADLGRPPCTPPPPARLPKSSGLSAEGFGPQAGGQVEEPSGPRLAVD